MFPSLYTVEEVRRLIITITFNLCTVVKVGELILIILITEFTYSGLWVAMSFFLTYNLIQCLSLFKIKPTYQGAGRVCQHKPYQLAHWQEWFITFTDLGKAKWSEALGEKMVTKKKEKEATVGLQAPPNP